ncbi:unnamed protein product [Paramecium sonneborni]|uniref:Uncharacterized protein n=1 Tax=Paramecium sonneborni TaxID=65129 RepID=A0A8S1R506_9CILI|nr:unnamed protein product [Paramecium sonneborni]
MQSKNILQKDPTQLKIVLQKQANRKNKFIRSLLSYNQNDLIILVQENMR